MESSCTERSPRENVEMPGLWKWLRKLGEGRGGIREGDAISASAPAHSRAMRVQS